MGFSFPSFDVALFRPLPGLSSSTLPVAVYPFSKHETTVLPAPNDFATFAPSATLVIAATGDPWNRTM